MKTKWNNLHTTLRIGLILLPLGISPLFIALGLDAIGVVEAGNALGPGILAFISFWTSIALIIIGSILTYQKSRKVKESE